MAEGQFTIPSRVYLGAAERAKLDRLLRHQGRELDELLTELLTGYLEREPEPPEPNDRRAVLLADELRQRRAELRRLRPQLTDPHNPPPAWLVAMVRDLGEEVRRLEAELAALGGQGS